MTITSAPPQRLAGDHHEWPVTTETRQALRQAFADAARRDPHVVADITRLDFRAPADFGP
ncbi:hypothetical protein ACU686_03710 [Yinghuangia aomiensis]